MHASVWCTGLVPCRLSIMNGCVWMVLNYTSFTKCLYGLALSYLNFIIQQSWASKGSAFRFVSWTVCSPYPTLNLRRQRPSFSSRRCTATGQSSAAYHVCSVTSCFLLSLEDILLRTLLSVITVVVPAMSFMDTLIALTYSNSHYCK